MRSVISAVVGITLGLVLTTGALAADRPDSWVTAKTKLALMTTEGVDTWDLNVDTVNGVVTLHGKVASDAAKQKAETVAQGIEGAKSVKNLLQVVPKPQREAVSDSDDVIADNVKKAFDADPPWMTVGHLGRVGEQGRGAAVGIGEEHRRAPEGS